MTRAANLGALDLLEAAAQDRREIKTGMPGIARLAAALGGEHHPPCESRKRMSRDHDKSVNHDALLKELGARSAPGPHLSALELSSGSVDKEFKKKNKKHKKSRKESSPSSSSSDCRPSACINASRVRLGSRALQRCQGLLLRSWQEQSHASSCSNLSQVLLQAVQPRTNSKIEMIRGSSVYRVKSSESQVCEQPWVTVSD